ncbi:uncharacterized protein V1510DRAFT_422267 [Dipodascopsis tothii]|uniref:uncharacterized protein n=1 Tax=Dipodascopsis tothii TaxID=44089 RepID=UPI0034CDFCB4
MSTLATLNRRLAGPAGSIGHHVSRRALSTRWARPLVFQRRPVAGGAMVGRPGAGPPARRISFFSAAPKALLKLVRVPAAAGGAVVAGVAYIEYQVQEAASFTQNKIDGAKDWVADQYGSARDMVGDLRMPDWMATLFEAAAPDGSTAKTFSTRPPPADGDEHGPDHEPEGPGSGAALAAAAAVTAAGADDERAAAVTAQMMLLTRKMIEIRALLQQIDENHTIQLPSIVVVGSQSSGKSSVLEAIVGHEFLPKGANMVTRRPIELTLVNAPDAMAEYGEFPALKMGKITDFSVIQRTLTDLNLAVPEAEAVSDDPIRLNIYSPHVPDLTLIDLPGYIQLAAHDQPETLRAKIAALCDRYIAAPNIILAISPADVDLANSTALRASRRIDPRGERTIGVITKMDLVDPATGVAVLTNRNYPLRMGYVGVISKAPPAGLGGALFGRGHGDSGTSLQGVIARNEEAYFSRHAEFGSAAAVVSPGDDALAADAEPGAMTLGVNNLRNKLIAVLERTMAKSLQPTADAIHQELEEAAYQFKVEYNDRPLTAETYLAQSLDAFKLSFKDFAGRFGREQVRALLKRELDQKVLDLVAQRYWNAPPDAPARAGLPPTASLADLATAPADDVFWRRQLDASVSSLTKCGVGRVATTLVSSALTAEMDHLLASGPFKTHPYVKAAIQDATAEILNGRFYSTADQVENCIKPFKYEVEVEDREWSQSREHAYVLLKDELRQCDDAYAALRRAVGGKKLAQVEAFVDRVRKDNGGALPLSAPAAGKEADEVYGFSQALLARGAEAAFLKDRAGLLRLRMAALKSKACRSKDNRYQCPEIFLDVVADKLTQTAVLFLNVELLSDFYYHFPRELDQRLGNSSPTLGREQIRVFATEDPKVKRHIELQERKQTLELALEKVEGVMAMQRGRH